MVQDMRHVENKKKRRISIPLLFVLNIFLWGSAIYLWMQDRDVSPITTNYVATGIEINVRELMEPVAFDDSFALTYEEVDMQIYSRYALLVNLDTHEILFNHRGNERVYPASVTKIMTVLVGLEYAVNDEVEIYADFDALFQAESAMAGFVLGETRTLSEVLHASLLSSGGDATTALAYHVADSYQGFVDLMNTTAWRLGMHDTHFINASGLHHEEHYTTAYDIALLLNYALRQPYFREIFTTPTYSFINSEGNEQWMQSTMFRNMETPIFTNGEILGGKTGFTTPAGFCLASLATDGISEFILITFDASTDQTPAAHVRDAFTIYEYFFQLENDVAY